jgi:hypothetical protein
MADAGRSPSSLVAGSTAGVELGAVAAGVVAAGVGDAGVVAAGGELAATSGGGPPVV